MWCAPNGVPCVCVAELYYPERVLATDCQCYGRLTVGMPCRTCGAMYSPPGGGSSGGASKGMCAFVIRAANAPFIVSWRVCSVIRMIHGLVRADVVEDPIETGDTFHSLAARDAVVGCKLVHYIDSSGIAPLRPPDP